MQTKETRLRRIQHLAHEMMDEMNRGNEPETVRDVASCPIDNLSRAIGDLAGILHGHYSLDYIEGKVGNAHYLLFKNEKKIKLRS